MKKEGYVYILANFNNKVLYIGVTSNLVNRVWQQRNKLINGFSKKYNLSKLLYYEHFDSIGDAITREKYLKGKKREFKIELIKTLNLEFRDLYTDILK